MSRRLTDPHMLSACNACVCYAISVIAGLVPAEVSGGFVPGILCDSEWHERTMESWTSSAVFKVARLCDALQPAGKIAGQGPLKVPPNGIWHTSPVAQ